MDNLAHIFGRVLYEKRKQKKITQTALAQTCDLERKYIYLLEKGINQPSLQSIFTLAEALSMTPMELLEEVYKRSKQEKKAD